MGRVGELMGSEIERKFLVRGDGWRDGVTARHALEQGYLVSGGATSVRVRIYDGAQAKLTLKAGGVGRVRAEYEYDIPLDDARELLALCGSRTLTKVRHLVPAGALTWEVDVFSGRHAGLVMAEIELEDAEQAFDRPDWLGEEVTEDERYYNSTLAGI
jgi:adenylate cyclase